MQSRALIGLHFIKMANEPSFHAPKEQPYYLERRPRRVQIYNSEHVIYESNLTIPTDPQWIWFLYMKGK